MEDIDPAKKQYFMFSVIIAILLSFLINFVLLNMAMGPFFSGFPVALAELEGISYFFGQIVNTLVIAGFLSIPIYYGFMWLINRGGY